VNATQICHFIVPITAWASLFFTGDQAQPLGDCAPTVFVPLWFAAHHLTQEPHPRIGPAKKVDLVAGEIEALQQQFGDRFHPVERESNAQALIGKQPLDDHSNNRS
jgi:hypothetical protein